MSKPTILAVAIAGVIALSALSPASAATRHKQAAVSPQNESTDGTVTAPVASRPGISGAPVSNWLMPNGCVSDEGYGRYSSCDGGTSN
jgi:hypothetical protein